MNQDHLEEEESRDDQIIGVVFRRSLMVMAGIVVVLVAIWFFRRETPATETIVDRETITAPEKLDQYSAERPNVPFQDVGEAVGIDFRHVNGARGEKLLPETMGSGVAFFDMDADGDQDLLFVNAAYWPHDDAAVAAPPTQALYRNDGEGVFTDVTPGSGLDVSLYGMGVATGDFDNDGLVDVFLTALGENRLFRNLGNGRFEDITARAGVPGPANAWSTSAGFADLDRDGHLDLWVCNYVQWSRDLDLKLAFSINGTDRAYGPPKQYEGSHNLYYRNRGDGTFADVTDAAGAEVVNPATDQPMGKALAVAFFDVDRDGWLDVFVANDTVQNFMFRNQKGQLEEVGAFAGLAFDSMGAATGAMGVDIADLGSGAGVAVGIGNFANESSSFYVQQPRDPWQFADMSNSKGIGSPSRLKLSFGLFFFDYDLDGRLDMLQANGHLEDEISEVQPSQHYQQPAQLFWNRGPVDNPGFAAVPEDELGDLAKPIVGRGAAYADMDGDGDLDVVLTQTGGKPLLLRNDQELGHHWLRVRLVGTADNRDAIGAVVTVKADGRSQVHQVMPTRSYLSQVELPVTFGLGQATAVESVSVTWPNGWIQNVTVDGVDREIVVEQASP